MTAAVSLLLIIAAGAFVAWPFFAVQASWRNAATDILSPLERQKAEAYAALKEAEFDWRTGKLSEADFATLNEKYRRQALKAIAAIEDERARTKRERKPAGVHRPPRVAFCPACGQRVPDRANFCGGCGRSVRQPAA